MKQIFSKFKKATSALLAAIMIFSVTACEEDDGSDYIFKYDIDGNPSTIDPQTATDASALLVIENVYDGLLALDENGNVVPSVAESYTVSDDGLTYVFKLREDVYWTDGDKFEAKCTAHDFVYAFCRLFNAETKAPKASEFFCIRRAESINRSGSKNMSLLGVTADNDYQLTISLEYPNPLLPVLLTTAPAMPCNEEYYNSTAGKYGLSADSVASNGAFYIYAWTYDKWSTNDNKLILRKNKLNDVSEKIYPYGLNFFVDQEDTLADFYAGTAHSIIASGDTAVELLNGGYSYVDNNNATWGILFNTKSVFSDINLRYSLALCVNHDTYPLTATGYTPAKAIVPDSITLLDIVYREFAGDNLYGAYDAKSAGNYYESALKTVGYDKVSGLKLIMPENEVMKTYMGYVMQDWQANVGFFCNLSELSASDYNTALNNGDFTFALVRLTGNYNSPAAYLSKFTGTGISNLSGYSDSDYAEILTDAQRATSTEESARYYLKAEQKLIEDSIFIPLAYQTEYFFLNEKCEDIIYNPFTKTIDYSNAKHF